MAKVLTAQLRGQSRLHLCDRESVGNLDLDRQLDPAMAAGEHDVGFLLSDIMGFPMDGVGLFLTGFQCAGDPALDRILVD